MVTHMKTLARATRATRATRAGEASFPRSRTVGGGAGQRRAAVGRGRRAAATKQDDATLAGVVFRPFAEVQPTLATVQSDVELANTSLGRQNFDERCEAALNDQINVEFNVSYVYHALHAYFDRDYVGLPGLANFFLKSSNEEREHAEMLMAYVNKRGGKVKLQSIMMPDMEFGGTASGDALYGALRAADSPSYGSVKIHERSLPDW